MVESQFKLICRLNRFLGLVLIAATLAALWNQPHPVAMLAWVGLFGLHGVFLIANEFLYKLVKRLREIEFQMLAHLSLFLPIGLGLYVLGCYALTGQFFICLFGMMAVLQAQLLDQTRLSPLLGGAFILLFALGVPFHVHHAVLLTPGMMLTGIMGLGACLYYYGMLVSQLLRSHSSELGKFQSMAVTDVLTGLTNRRQFNIRLHEEVARARRHDTPLSLALFDLDNFKQLNDYYGHPVGDQILKQLGRLIRENIRESDLAARYGGEEFALILPETQEFDAYELLERLRQLVAQTVFCLPENPLTITISIGIAQLEPRRHTAFELVELADKALYEAKRQGKNQVIRGQTLLPKVLLRKKKLSAL